MSNPNLVRKSATSTMPGEASFNEISAAIGGGGGGGGTGKNYITTGSTFDSASTAGWSLTKATLDATTKVPNAAASGSATGLSIGTVGSGLQLSVSGNSLSLVSTGSTLAGDMLLSDAITLDQEAQSSIQTFSFFYKVASGSGNFSGTSSNTLGVAVYAVNGSSIGWIQPAGAFNLVQSSGVGKASGTFQVPAGCTSVRLAIYFPNNTASAITVYLDDFVLGPQVVQYGAPVTDWQSYTPTFGGVGTAVGVSFKYRRVGDTIQVTGLFATGTPTAAQFTISLPNAIDATKIGGTAATIGNLTRGSTSFQASSIIVRTDLSTSVVYSGGQYTAAQLGLTPQNGNSLFPAGETVAVEFFYPAAGLSSSVQMSNDTDTRVVAARATKSGSQSIVTAGETTVTWDTYTFDTHGGFSGNTYNIRVSGFYKITAILDVGNLIADPTGYVTCNIKKGSTSLQSIYFYGNPNGEVNATNTGIFQLVAGDQITIAATSPDGNYTIRPNSFFTVERISGPATIAANETVAFLASGTAGDTIGTSESLIKFTSIEDSSHGAYSASTGVFTAPVSGRYNATWAVITSGISLGTTQRMYSTIYKNGVSYKLGNRVIGSGGAGQQYMSIGTLNDIVLKAGDTLSIYAASDVATTATTATSINYFAVTKIGN